MLETARYHEGKLKMQTKENAKDLIAMGYRLLGANKNDVTIYAKPFGYGLFTVSFEGGIPVFRQRFKDLQGAIAVWSSFNFNGETYATFLEWLKYAETWHARSGLEVGIGSSFEFLTAEQLVEDLCSGD